MKSNQINELLDNGPFVEKTTLQALWSNYGEIARYANHRKGYSIIVKNIQTSKQQNHPRGWNTQTSHQRKLKSYQVEAAFYQHYSACCDDDCYVPQFFEYRQKEDISQLIMEDLTEKGFEPTANSLTSAEIEACIKWLAYFHAKFLGVEAKELWPIGSYWHLATRQDEYQKMNSGELKSAAKTLDEKLNNAKYQTIIHGDAKQANFCFHVKQNKVAAVDFQYVGCGVGVKDLSYFLGSCLSAQELIEQEEKWLELYFLFLHKAIKSYQKLVEFAELEQEWRNLYSVACADFHRFLVGWKPDHIKINTYLELQTERALSKLNIESK